MPTYTDVTNLPAAPYSAGAIYLNLKTPGQLDQKYVWQGSPGFWAAVTDSGGVIASAPTLQTYTARFEYDFAIDGGAVGDHILRQTAGSDGIPGNAIVTSIITDKTVDFASGGLATVQETLEATGDVEAQEAFDLAVDAGTAVIIPAVNSALGAMLFPSIAVLKPITTTARRDLVFTIGTAALTAGAFAQLFTYVVTA